SVKFKIKFKERQILSFELWFSAFSFWLYAIPDTSNEQLATKYGGRKELF
ncbi:unnamed protein product, partial [marine sediment metagenome]